MRYDQPEPTATDAGCRPVGLWLKGFAAFRAKGLRKGWKFRGAEGSKPFLSADGSRLLGRLGSG